MVMAAEGQSPLAQLIWRVSYRCLKDFCGAEASHFLYTPIEANLIGEKRMLYNITNHGSACLG